MLYPSRTAATGSRLGLSDREGLGERVRELFVRLQDTENLLLEERKARMIAEKRLEIGTLSRG